MIYFLEDDESIRKLVIYTLESQGLSAEGFENPSGFWAAMRKGLPELILLDVMLPEEDGLQVLARLRESDKTRRLPVIMLTAKGSEYDKVVALDAGADDYVAKPFGMMELMARIRALLRRTGVSQDRDEYTVGNLYVCVSKHIVRAGGADVALTLKEFELLCLLLENAGTVLTRDQILNRVWDYDYDGANRTVDVHIQTLRQKLGESGGLIETVRGIGYRIGGAAV